MQILIDISEGMYNELQTCSFPLEDAYRVVDAIIKGKALPKGHGDLIDRSLLIEDMERAYRFANELVALGFAESFIEHATTIIEADKEGAEEERFERILESASAQVPLRGKREENRPTWQQDREGGAE